MQLHGQSNLLSSGDGELIFERDPNTFHESVDIKLELVGIVFNERAYYSTIVDPQHKHANYYPAGPYLTGTGPNTSITLPTSGSPRQITWESAAYDDGRPPNHTYGDHFEYCPGMVGWGLYKVTLSSTDGDMVFYLNTVDGNWLNPSNGGNHDIIIRVKQGWFGAPVCAVKNYNTYSFDLIPNQQNPVTVSYWDISTVGRGRDELARAWDYSQSAISAAPFEIITSTDYPLEHNAIGIYIDYAKLDVNAELHADMMTIDGGKTFEIADWTDGQSQIQSTTLTVMEDKTIDVDGEFILMGNELSQGVYSISLEGETAQRGFWNGIKVEDEGLLTIDYAHLLHADYAIKMHTGSELNANHCEIAEFARYGVHQTDSKAVVKNTSIHDGSIGVYATGECFDSYYGWREGEANEMPVYVYNCDGHGFELEDLVEFVENSSVINQRGFCIQFSEIYDNQLYGIWIHGTGSPLVNENNIYRNGLYGGQTPSHDGVHVNAGTHPSIHKNKIYSNAYGLHHNDAGAVFGRVFEVTGNPLHSFATFPKLGYNCFVANTINIGCNRSAQLNLGYQFNGDYELYDHAEKKWNGSNCLVDPVSGYQASNGTGTVFAEHNCWQPSYVVSGTIITNGDFADCLHHDLPDCTPPPEPERAENLIASSATGWGSSELAALLVSYNAFDWQTVKSQALNILSNSTNSRDIALAAVLLARLPGITNDSTIESHLQNFVSANATNALMPLEVRHAVLASLLYLKVWEKNTSAALQLCSQIEQVCAGTDLAKTGTLFRGFILGKNPVSKASAVSVAEGMLAKDPSDAEALALYYSLTHTYPPHVPKTVAVVPSTDIALFQNYPNPFNPLTDIRLYVPQDMHVRLHVRDITGRQVAILLDENVPAGVTTVAFDGSAFHSGMYFYTLETAEGSVIKRMILLK